MFPQDKVRQISQALDRQLITYPFVKAAILAVVFTETAFNIRSESSYRKTPVSRLRLLFGKRLAKFTDDQLTKLRTDDVAFFDAVYGGYNGNLAVGDGFRYRGRGYNEITFKNSYLKYGTMIGVDLVSSPERLNEAQLAADALAAYFKDGFRIGQLTLKTKYQIDDLSHVNDLPTACNAAHQCNAGWGTDLKSAALQEIHQKQLHVIDELYHML